MVQLEGLWQCKDFSGNQRICVLERKKGSHLMAWGGKGLSPHSLSARSLFLLELSKGSEVGQHGGGHEYSAENITSARGWILTSVAAFPVTLMWPDLGHARSTCSCFVLVTAASSREPQLGAKWHWAHKPNPAEH